MEYVKSMDCGAYISRMVATGYDTMEDLRHCVTLKICMQMFGMPYPHMGYDKMSGTGKRLVSACQAGPVVLIVMF